MDTKEDGESHSDQPPSPMGVLQQLSEVAIRAAEEGSDNAYDGGSCSTPKVPPGHRRCQSEVVTGGLKRSDSYQKLKSHVQKAWRWGSKSREEGSPTTFNPEVLANQKRQWYQLNSKTLDCVNYKEPTSLFEHFVIVGLHPDANLEAVEDAFANRKKWEKEEKYESEDFQMPQQQGSPVPMLEPQILFKFPPGKKLTMRMKDLASFCFPGGVKASLLERTPSLSELNELVYGQMHLGRDDLSFIFSLKAAENATLYGVCLHAPEIVQRPPGILGISSPLSLPSGVCSRFLVSAPRCYCLLTRVPFFELHYEMLNSLIAQERLSRITQFVNEMTLTGSVLSMSKQDDQLSENDDTPQRGSFSDWMSCAIPVENAAVLAAAAVGIISDDEISAKNWYPESPTSMTASDASDFSQLRDIDKDVEKSHDGCASEAPQVHPDSSERLSGNYENGQTSPELETHSSSRKLALELLGGSQSPFRSPVRSMVSEEEEDDLFAINEKDYGDDLLMEWARENKNDLLQIVCRYHTLPLPRRGSEIIFHPLDHLQPILYRRPSVVALGFLENCLNCFEPAKVNAKLAAAEEALAFSIWATATICRVLSLESLLALIAGVLLEKQVVVVCPNLGVLSAAVLSVIPMIRPFQWQSLFLPVLPQTMFDFLDAPVPYIIGIQHKPADLKIKTTNLILVDVLKDQVKMCYMPRLPRHKELISQLGPFHAKLSCESSTAKRQPVYRCNEFQAEAATQFLDIMWRYVESLCSDLRLHTITSVQSNSDRVSLLLKDSFIDSFPSRDRPFIKQLVDTQLFSVLSDSRLSSFENDSYFSDA
ncbi:DENN domain-containing protein 5B [Senna tora]|uniref:DENN domain-containing protein 5B n=1 Tax=Senna tora TaxID=362788 RepID=A0A834WDE4_9FABA|nr:DENN domain-containing protein 5B [Senna tora]